MLWLHGIVLNFLSWFRCRIKWIGNVQGFKPQPPPSTIRLLNCYRYYPIRSPWTYFWLGRILSMRLKLFFMLFLPTSFQIYRWKGSVTVNSTMFWWIWDLNKEQPGESMKKCSSEQKLNHRLRKHIAHFANCVELGKCRFNRQCSRLRVLWKGLAQIKWWWRRNERDRWLSLLERKLEVKRLCQMEVVQVKERERIFKVS
jgi:hypothetical protein